MIKLSKYNVIVIAETRGRGCREIDNVDKNLVLNICCYFHENNSNIGQYLQIDEM